MRDAMVVFARCAETGLQAPRELSALGIPFRVQQKAAPCNTSARGASTLAQLPSHRVRVMDHNAGDECSAYLQYLHEEYHRLPKSMIFLQYGGEKQLVTHTAADAVRVAVDALSRLGFVALSRHTFEGQWPAPCEASGKQATFRACATKFWNDGLHATPPSFLRFYANGCAWAALRMARNLEVRCGHVDVPTPTHHCPGLSEPRPTGRAQVIWCDTSPSPPLATRVVR